MERKIGCNAKGQKLLLYQEEKWIEWDTHARTKVG